MAYVGGDPKTRCLVRGKGRTPSFLTLLKCFTRGWTLWTPGVLSWELCNSVEHALPSVPPGGEGLRSLSPIFPSGIASKSCRGL